MCLKYNTYKLQKFLLPLSSRKLINRTTRRGKEAVTKSLSFFKRAYALNTYTIELCYFWCFLAMYVCVYIYIIHEYSIVTQ